MAKKLNSVLGVDVGCQKIKIAEIKLQGREPVITALGIADTPEGAVDHTGIYNGDAVGQVLKDLAAGAGATVNQVVVSIAGQGSVLVRTLEVPRMNPGELKEHMNWEVQRNIPFSESNVVSDFEAFEPEDPNAQNLDVVMAISPQSAIDTVVGLVKKAGKQTAAIDVEPLGIARSLMTSHADDLAGATVCVVDIGHKTTSINIYKNGKLLMPRQVPIGGEMLTRAIADGMNITFEEAEDMKRNRASIPDSAAVGGAAFAGGMGAQTQQFSPYNPFADDPMMMNPGLLPPEMQPEAVPEAEPEPPVAPPTGVEDPETNRIFNTMASILEEFVAEVRRSIDYFRSKGGDVDRLELCGGGSKLRGLADFLGKSVGINAELYDPLRNIQIQARKLDPEMIEQNRQDFAIAVGNGLHIAYDRTTR